MKKNINTNEQYTRPTSSVGRAWSLFTFFFTIGFFTFGGGWSIIAQMTKEFVEKRKWITKEELMDMVSISQSLPGIMIVNTSVQFGYKIGGLLGSVAAALGMVLPSFIVLAIVTACYTKVRDNVYVARALTGVRAAVVPIIISAALKLRKAALADKLGWTMCIAALCISLFTPLSKIIIIICGVLIGIGVALIGSSKKTSAANTEKDKEAEK